MSISSAVAILGLLPFATRVFKSHIGRSNASTGALYTVRREGSFGPNGIAHMAFSQSTGSARVWSADQGRPVPVGAPAFTPVVHVDARGASGVAYYEWRARLESATAASPTLTDELIMSCHRPPPICTQQSSWATGSETKLDTNGPST